MLLCVDASEHGVTHTSVQDPQDLLQDTQCCAPVLSQLPTLLPLPRARSRVLPLCCRPGSGRAKPAAAPFQQHAAERGLMNDNT